MNPEFLAPLIPVVAIIAFAAVKIARIRASGAGAADIVPRLDSLEHTVHRLQQDLTETQDRLDFAERVLSQAREERHLGS